MSGTVKMQGVLEPGLLLDMLQVFSRRRNLNGYVEVMADSERGMIWVQDGSLIAANWKDRQGELAVESMLRLKQGGFQVGEATVLPVRTIFKDTVGLLMMCMRSIGRDALAPGPSQAVPPLLLSAPTRHQDEVVATPVPLPAKRSPRWRAAAGTWCKSWYAVGCVLPLLVGTVLLLVWAGMQGESGGNAVVHQLPLVVPAPVQIEVPVPVKPAPVLRDGWPDVMLSALAGSGTRSHCAILNGRLLGVGEQVDGVTICSIRPDGVVLEYQGQRRFLCAVKRN